MKRTAITRPGKLAPALVLVAALLASCSGDDDETAASDDGGSGQDPYVTNWYEGGELGLGTDAEQGPLGSEDPEIGEIPEEIPTTPFPDVEADHVVVVESFGMGLGAAHVVDLEEGSVGYIDVATGADIWMPAGGSDDLPLAVASVERFRPRGMRGEIQAVVTFWDPDGAISRETVLPRYQYPSAGAAASQMTSDGRYVVINDRLLPGFLLLDVESGEVVDELNLEPTCLPRLYLDGADTAYAVCWESGEVVEIAIGDGTLEEEERAVAFAPGTPVLEDPVFSPESGLLTVYTRFSEVLPLDLSEGLPEEEVEPVEIPEDGHIIRTGQTYLTPDGSTAVVGYVEGDDYASGDPAVWRVFDTSSWEETNRIDFDQDDEAPDALLPTSDSSGMLVLRSDVEVPVEGEPDETEDGGELAVVDLASGEETSSTPITPTSNYDSFSAIYLPVVMEDAG